MKKAKSAKLNVSKAKPIYCPLFAPAQHIGCLNDVLIVADISGRVWLINGAGQARPVVFSE